MITVKAVSGVRVPMEGMPRRHITDAAPVAVPDAAYYRRRIADGDLVLLEGEAIAEAEAAAEAATVAQAKAPAEAKAVAAPEAAPQKPKEA